MSDLDHRIEEARQSVERAREGAEAAQARAASCAVENLLHWVSNASIRHFERMPTHVLEGVSNDDVLAVKEAVASVAERVQGEIASLVESSPRHLLDERGADATLAMLIETYEVASRLDAELAKYRCEPPVRRRRAASNNEELFQQYASEITPEFAEAWAELQNAVENLSVWNQRHDELTREYQLGRIRALLSE